MDKFGKIGKAKGKTINRSLDMKAGDCPVCFCKYSERLRSVPRLLQCGHTFCHACLEKIKKNSAIECPLDRELTSVKDNDICALRKNFALMAVCSSRQGPSSNMDNFREYFAKAKHIVVLTGAGISAESGVPTFSGAGGHWRNWCVQRLATPEVFQNNPSLVWELYHYRREVMATKNPNKAHIAIAECEKRLKSQGRRVVVITQNIDELHKRAGSENILELHRNLFTTRCTKCGDIAKNYDSPICEALRGKGSPDPDTEDANIPVDQLPKCKNCGALTRPNVVWFGENLDRDILNQVAEELQKCDLCLVVGTSSKVYPAAMFAPQVAKRGVPVAEFNMEETDVTSQFGYHFQGPAGSFLPEALAPTDSEDVC